MQGRQESSLNVPKEVQNPLAALCCTSSERAQYTSASSSSSSKAMSLHSLPLPLHQLNVMDSAISIDEEDDKDDDNVNATEFRRNALMHEGELAMFYNMVFLHQVHEDGFLQHELDRCFTRSNVTHAITMILLAVGAVDENGREDSNMTMVMSCVICGVVHVGAMLVGGLMMITRDARTEKSSAAQNGGTNAEENIGNDVHFSKSHQCCVLENDCLKETKKVHPKDNRKKLERMIPRLQEFRCLVCVVTLSVAFTFIYASVQSRCRYSRVHGIPHDHVPEDHHDCPFHLWAMPWIGIVWLVVGQPRFFFFAATNVLLIPLTIGIITFHGLTLPETVILYVFIVVLMLFWAALKYFEERRSRRQYAMSYNAEKRQCEVHERTVQLHEFLKRIVPQHLQRSRLSDASPDVVRMDIAEEATCVVLFVSNSVKFMQSRRPLQGASLLATVGAHGHQVCNRYHFHHIRSIGDNMYFVSNLFNDDTADEGAARAVLNAIRFSACFWDLPDPWDHLDIYSGVGFGKLIGVPVGRTVIHYDVLGPALTEAEELSKLGKRHRVAVSEAVYTAHALKLAVNTETIDSSAQSVDDATVVLVEGIVEETETTRNRHPSPDNRHDVVERISPMLLSQPLQAEVTTNENLHNTTTLESYAWFFKRFTHASTEAMFRSHQEDEAASTIQFVTGFNLFMAVVVLAMMIVHFSSNTISTQTYERTSGGHQKHAGVLHQTHGSVFVALWIGAVLSFLAVLLFVRVHKSVRAPTRFLFFAATLLLFTGTSLMRPSPMANAVGYQLLVFTIGSFYCGGSEPVVVSYFTLLHAMLMILGLFYHPILTRIFFFTPAHILVFYNTYLHFTNQERCLFAALLARNAALEEIQAHERVRNAVLRSIIPRQVESRMDHGSLNTQKIDCWNQEDCVVISVLLTQPHREAALLQHSSQALRSSNADRPQDKSIRFSTELSEVTNQVENIVASCQHRSVEIIHVFGDQLLIAGPLDTTTHHDFNHHDQPSQNLAAAKTTTDHSLQNAVSDAVEILSNMQTHTPDLKFTAAVVFEQVISAARFTLYPTFDLFGPAVNMARAICVAAPAEMVVATEKLANFYTREILHVNEHDSKISTSLNVAPPETWRIRGLGSMSVCRFEHR